MKINRLLPLTGTAALVLASGLAGSATQPERAADRALPSNLALLKLGAPVQSSGISVATLDCSLLATPVNVTVEAPDFYFGGPGDLVTGLTVTPLGVRFFGTVGDIAGKGSGVLGVTDFGVFPGNSPKVGLMLITNGGRGTGNRGGATQATEAVLFRTQ